MEAQWNISPTARRKQKRWANSLAAVCSRARSWPIRAVSATAFTRGLARGLGCGGRVTSPTFTIVNEYPGRIPLFHFDVYRLDGSDALYDIGWDDYLDRGGVCAVEWSEQIADALPEDAIHVRICRPEDGEDNTRCITIEGAVAL